MEISFISRLQKLNLEKVYTVATLISFVKLDVAYQIWDSSTSDLGRFYSLLHWLLMASGTLLLFKRRESFCLKLAFFFCLVGISYRINWLGFSFYLDVPMVWIWLGLLLFKDTKQKILWAQLVLVTQYTLSALSKLFLNEGYWFTAQNIQTIFYKSVLARGPVWSELDPIVLWISHQETLCWLIAIAVFTIELFSFLILFKRWQKLSFGIFAAFHLSVFFLLKIMTLHPLANIFVFGNPWLLKRVESSTHSEGPG